MNSTDIRRPDELLIGFLKAVSAVAVAIVATVVFAAGARWAAAGDTPSDAFGGVDIGFLQDMTDHHNQAIVIARSYLRNNPNGGAATYANEVLLFQVRELDTMIRWLAEIDLGSGPAERTAMTWMGMAATVSAMPGMQTPQRLDELAEASGANADELFFEMMGEHHLGGAHMAEFAATQARHSDVRAFATTMARNQRIEVVEYRQAAKRLGLTVTIADPPLPATSIRA